MKTPLTILLVASLVGNAAFAVYTLRNRTDADTTRQASSSAPGSTTTSHAAASGVTQGKSTATASTAAVAQWRGAKTDTDMRNVVASLRAAGYPPSVVRAVVNQMLAERFQTTDPNQPFWKRGRDTAETVTARQQASQDMAALREELLGADGTPAAMLSASERTRRYGALSDDKINALLKLDQEYNDVRSLAYASRDRTNASGRDLQQQQQELEKEKRADLAAILSPAELEAYDMRTSQAAQRTMSNLRDIDVTEAEYAKLYQAQKAHDDATPQRGEFNGAEGMVNRLVSQAELNEQARAVLGDDRFYKYLESSDGTYGQVARFAAQQLNMTPTTTYQLYQLQSEMMLSMAGARGSENGPPTAQRMSEVRAIAESYNARLQSLLGVEAAEAYRKQGMGRMFTIPANGGRRGPGGN